MRLLRMVGAASLMFALAQCGGSDGGPSGPVPGSLSLNLNTPNANDGAVMVTINGGVVDSVSTAAMAQYTSSTIQPGYTKIVVAGNITDGVIAKIWVPDVHAKSSYTVVVSQAAVRNTFTQQTVTGYSVTLTTP